MRILKLGWEFPPNNYGGLGIACESIVKGLIESGVEVLLILPRHQEMEMPHCRIISTDTKSITINHVLSLLQPYISSSSYAQSYRKQKEPFSSLYGENIFAEVERYAHVVTDIIKNEPFDIIHAHDWMSFRAGILAKNASGKPLVVHIHATEFDRTGGNGVHQTVYDIEREGMHVADAVICVSNFTKQKIMQHYGINAEKIKIIYNAIGSDQYDSSLPWIKRNGPLILFLGRLTLQKGPDYFVSLARALLPHQPHALFVIVGSGDMEYRLIEWVAREGLSDKILFTGQLAYHHVHHMYRMADVYVMPSVSEPFGLTALESMKQGTPVILSKQAGVAEIVNHVLRVDFWDINEMANKIIALLAYKELHSAISTNAKQEVQKFNWLTVAQQCIKVYKHCLGWT